MLTAQEYEQFKKKLQDANRELLTLEAKQAQVIEQLRNTYGLTPEEAQAEVNRLREEIPKLEAEFNAKYQEFMEKWQAIQNNN